MIFSKKIHTLLLLLTFSFFLNIGNADAYVSVRGYYRSNGTYVAPYVRSSPNGLKSDNYSYKGGDVYNKTYGTRGTTWDTPTYITDPYYYEGKALYESQSAGGTSLSPSSYNSPNSSYNTVTGGYKISGTLFCNSGYYKEDGSCILAPLNSTAYGGDTFYCSTGYEKTESGCSKLVKENATLVGSSFVCNQGFISFSGQCVNYDTYCAKRNGEKSFYYEATNSCASCPDGLRYDRTTLTCRTNELIEATKRSVMQEQATARLNRKLSNSAGLNTR